MLKEHRDFIDNASYTDLVKLQRFAPLSSPYFIIGSDTFDYFTERFNTLRKEASEAHRIQASKNVGY